MNEAQILEKMKKLKLKIEHHNKKYYEDDDPEIEDWEYDKLKRELEESAPNFYEAKIGGKASEKFAHVKHDIKMGSLHVSFSMSEILKFYNKVYPEQTQGFVVEPKIDGISLSVEYQNGILTCASTRGDGTIGEDITENALAIKNLPHKINTNLKYLEVRGECYMPKQAFKELNDSQKYSGGKPFKNPRNAAAGSIRQKDANKCKSRNLQILFFNVQRISNKEFKTHSESLEFLKSLGLPVVDFKKCENFDEIEKAIENIGKIRDNFTYQVGGAVLKINSLKERAKLGSTASFPRWAEAFKYPPEIKRTKCINIELNVGRTGIITPVCVFEPANLGGSVVTRASLHNAEFIRTKDIRINDFVFVIKSGDIIPEIVKSEPNSNTKRSPEFRMPDFCPSCGSKLVFEKHGSTKIAKCKNKNCFGKIKAKIMHFTSRDALNIKNFGEETVNILKSEIKNFSDIYTLNKNILSKYKQFRKVDNSNNQSLLIGYANRAQLNKTGKNLLDSIEKSKNSSLENLIYGLGIPFVGKETSKFLAKHFKKLENLQKSPLDELLQIEDIGAKTAQSIFDFFHDEQNIKNLSLIKKLGVNTAYIP